jgi:hypothetical protein
MWLTPGSGAVLEPGGKKDGIAGYLIAAIEVHDPPTGDKYSADECPTNT